MLQHHTEGIIAPPSPHGWKVRGREKHLEEFVKWLALDKGVQAPGVQAEGTEDVGQRAQDLLGRRHLVGRVKE